jgi:hypothetical protein
MRGGIWHVVMQLFFLLPVGRRGCRRQHGAGETAAAPNDKVGRVDVVAWR